MSNIPTTIKKLIDDHNPNVTHLDLSNLGLNDDDISELQEHLKSNKYITSLNLANNNITFKGCQLLRLINSLRKLDISHCPIGDQGIEQLVSSKINELNVSFCGVKERGATLLKTNIDKFVLLSIEGNPHIPNAIAQAIRVKFVKETPVSTYPLGLDLGLNIDSSYSIYLADSKHEPLIFRKESTESPTSQELLDKVFNTDDPKKLLDLPLAEKERLLKKFAHYLGFEDISIKPQNGLKT